VTGIGQTLLSAVLTLVGAGFSFDTALVLIPIMVILNAVGIAHVATPWGRENASFVESELPVRTSQAVSRLPLSPRERDVVMELLKGRTRSQIGEALFISPETVKWHTSRIYRKLGVSSRIQLLQRVLGETDVPSAE
jgi:DNA-binding CsgD family transcriptional regulator